MREMQIEIRACSEKDKWLLAVVQQWPEMMCALIKAFHDTAERTAILDEL